MSATPCPHCGQPMQGGVAIACLGGGKAVNIQLPLTCVNRVCQDQRSEAALQAAVKKGLIDP